MQGRQVLLDQITSALLQGGAVVRPRRSELPRSYIATAPVGLGALRQHVLTDPVLYAASLHATNEFASHMVASMHLAGLDRRYGTLATELHRISEAVTEGSPNAVVDLAVLPKLQKLDGRFSESADDSNAELPTRSAEVHALSEKSIESLFQSGGTRGDAHAFSFERGLTDPSELVQKLVGPHNKLSTPSVHAYLGLTLCDPYAYGVTGTRSVLTFVVSLIIRTMLRASGKYSEEQWPLSSIDREVAAHGELHVLLSGNSGIDARLIKRATRIIEHLPTFESMMQCVGRYTADSKELDESFHALYTVLKACYIVHFATDWLSEELNAQMRWEAMEATRAASAATAAVSEPARYDASLLGALERHVFALDSALTYIRKLKASGADEITLRGKYADVYRLALTLSGDIERAQGPSPEALRPWGIEDWAVYVKPKGGAKVKSGATRRAPGGNTGRIDLVLYAGSLSPDKLMSFSKTVFQGPGIFGKSSSSRQLTALEGVWESAVPLQYYTGGRPPPTMRDAETALDDIDADEIESVGLAVRYYACAMLAYHKDTLAADRADSVSAAGQKAHPVGVKVRRFYRMRAALMCIGRVYSFLYKLDSGPADAKVVPRIVTMLRGAGWHKRGDGTAGPVYLELYRAMFAKFTDVMASGVLVCHHAEDDATRCIRLSTGLVQLREKTLRLMAAIQRRIHAIVPSCHPFRYAGDTQLTLPNEIVAQMLPTSDMLPPDWSVAHLLYNRNSDVVKATPGAEPLLRAVLGEKSFRRFEIEHRASISLIELIKKGKIPRGVTPTQSVSDEYAKTHQSTSERAADVMRSLAVQNSALR